MLEAVWDMMNYKLSGKEKVGSVSTLMLNLKYVIPSAQYINNCLSY